MDDPAGVRRGKSTGNSQRNANRLRHWDSSRLHPLTQASALQAFRYEERDAAVLAGVVHGENVRVIERAGRSRFFRKTPDVLGITGVVRQENLDGDIAAQTIVAGPPDLARPSGSQQTKDGVRADALSRLQGPAADRDAVCQEVERRPGQELP